MTDYRLRFAPSPTGHLHIGGARTALYNYLVAQKQKGKFILRIEDTDRERSTQEYVDSILKAMEWLKLSYDEGPFFQTKRFDIYRSHMEKLKQEGTAYPCYCTAEELEQKRQLALSEGRKPKYDGSCRKLFEEGKTKDLPACIRFKAPETGSTLVKDLIRNSIEFQNQELDDLIIWRTDDTPTYNFTVVVDDVDMKITHVIRGDDHLNNTPRQILLYQALGYPTPLFAHVPMILGADKARLSKRHGATSVLAYRDMGYLPDALLNYLARLGWAYGDQEVFSRQELIQAFSIDAVGTSPSVFNPEKLLWLNGLTIRNHQAKDLIPDFKYQAELKSYPLKSDAILEGAIQCSLEKAKTMQEMLELNSYLFTELTVEESAIPFLTKPENKNYLKALKEGLEKLENFNRENIHELFNQLISDLNIKIKTLAQAARAALCGKSISPGIYDVIFLLGKEESLKRIEKGIQY